MQMDAILEWIDASGLDFTASGTGFITTLKRQATLTEFQIVRTK